MAGDKHSLPRFPDNKAIILRGRTWRKIAETLEAWRPRPGRNVSISVTPTGTIISALAGLGGEGAVPFRLHSWKQDGGAWKFKVTPGFVLTIQPGSTEDAIAYIEPAGGEDEMTAETGKALYVIAKSSAADLITEAEFAIDEDGKESEHAQPVTPEGEEREGEYWYKIAAFDAPSTPGAAPVVRVYHEGGPIYHRPTLWSGENVGGGAGILHKWNGADSRYEFRSLKALLAMEVLESGEEVTIDWKAENVGVEGTAVLANPDGDAGDPAKFRKVARESVSIAPPTKDGTEVVDRDVEIVVTLDGDVIRLRGKTQVNEVNGKTGVYTFLDHTNTPYVMEFKNGLLVSTRIEGESSTVEVDTWTYAPPGSGEP